MKYLGLIFFTCVVGFSNVAHAERKNLYFKNTQTGVEQKVVANIIRDSQNQIVSTELEFHLKCADSKCSTGDREINTSLMSFRDATIRSQLMTECDPLEMVCGDNEIFSTKRLTTLAARTKRLVSVQPHAVLSFEQQLSIQSAMTPKDVIKAALKNNIILITPDGKIKAVVYLDDSGNFRIADGNLYYDSTGGFYKLTGISGATNASNIHGAINGFLSGTVEFIDTSTTCKEVDGKVVCTLNGKWTNKSK